MGIRVIKSAVAATLAVYFAQFMGLSSPLSAALLAILGIDVTKKRGLKSAAIRFLASLFGLFVGAILFYICGYQVWVIGLFVLTVYPILSRLRLNDGIISGTVVMIHLYTSRSLAPTLIWNEVLLLFVGLGTATAVNLIYMPNPEKRLQETRYRIEELFSAIFKEIALHLRVGDAHVWDGSELLEAGKEIREGAALAANDVENRLFSWDENWREYFEMRHRQLDSIGRMLDLVAQVYLKLPPGEATAELFDRLQVDVKEPFYTGNSERQLEELYEWFKALGLPSTREEFELRSAILQLCLELEAYLSVARTLKKRKDAS